ERSEITRAGYETRTPVAVITRSLADRLFPDSEAVGKRVWTSPEGFYDIIGIVENLSGGIYDARGIGPDYSLLMPMRYFMDGIGRYVVRTEPGKLDTAMRLASERLRAVDPTRTIAEPQGFLDTRKQHLKGAVGFVVMLLGVSVLLVGVVTFGIVGLAWHWLFYRQVQIGVRRALGAQRSDILRQFLAENLAIVIMGVLIGLVLAFSANSWLAGQVEMPALTLDAMLTGAAIILLVSQIAVFWPALRASRIAPIAAARAG